MKINNVKISQPVGFKANLPRRVHVANQTVSKPHGKPSHAYDKKKERSWKPESED